MTTFSKRILNLQNSTPSTELDRYNSFDILPDFKATPETDTSNIRFNRFDIERSTVLLSNLKSLRAGYLLVRGYGEDDTEIGIIIDPGNRNLSENDPFDISEVLVLSVTEEKGRVNLSYWGSSHTNNSFTDRPKEFLARRLIKFNGEIDSNTGEYNFTQYSEETWDIFSSANNNPLALLELHNRWIPNTGEPLTIDSIKVENDEEYDGLEVILKAPTDKHYDTSGTEHNSSNRGNNILVNKGDGFEFFAKYVTNKETKLIKLATFNLNTLSDSDLNRYSVDYNEKIFNEDNGTCKSGYSLVYKSDEGIKFSFDRDKETIMFAIRPLENNIRPGDDLLLNFDFVTSTGKLPVETRSDNYIATYDHKMLWRANLYIAELATDWNNENPWNAPPTSSESVADFTYRDGGEYYLSPTEKETDAVIWYGYNEWNRRYDGSERLSSKIEPSEEEYLRDLDQGNGRQVIDTIMEFNYHDQLWGEYDFNAVSYAYGSSDSPFEFNDEMRQQQQSMANYYNEDGKKFLKPRNEWPKVNGQPVTEISQLTKEQYNEYVYQYPTEEDTPVYPQKAISLKGWDSTLTLKNESWDPLADETYITTKMMFDVEISSNPESFPPDGTEASDIEYFPFLPGYSLWYHFKYGVNDPPNWINAISAGVDCNGFVSRAYSYYDRNYKWSESINHNVLNSNKWFNSPSYPKHEGSGRNAYLITSYLNKTADYKSYIDLDKVRPGDIMHFDSHITTVSEVDNSDGTIEPEDIKLIESTWGGDKRNNFYEWARVVTGEFTLKDYENFRWKIIRLMEDN